MGLVNWIYSVGGKLRILQVSTQQEVRQAVAIQMRTVTIEQLTSEIRGKEVQALAQLPAELSLEFDKVFDAAGVKPAEHGWTIVKLQELLDTPQYKSMKAPDVQQAVLGLLQAQKAPVEDLVKDAVARDQALDAFEEFARKKMQVRDEARQREVIDIKAQIDQLQKQCQQLADDATSDKQQWRAWHKKKTDYEKTMAAALGHLLDKTVVTLDENDE